MCVSFSAPASRLHGAKAAITQLFFDNERLLEEFDREMSLHDLDSTTAEGAPGIDGERRLCSIGIYYYEKTVSDETSQES